MNAPIVLPDDMREDAWTAWVIDLAMRFGWRVTHFRTAKTPTGYRTPIQGHKGAPDLLLCRRNVLIAAELKTNRGRLAPEQREWLDHLGSFGRVWRPRDVDAVFKELRDAV